MHTGQLEGINNRIKVIKRMAYGYRDSEFFFMKIKSVFPGNPYEPQKRPPEGGLFFVTPRARALLDQQL
nr:transposase [Pseudomonas fluorescens]